ncbi:MAG: phage tail assembly chaperone [Pseudomonas fluorescens]
MFYSASTGGFYSSEIHGDNMPADVVAITAKNHSDLLAGQSEGKVISWGDDGYPVLIDPPLPTPEQLAQVERYWRDAQLAATDGVVTRHRDEVEEGVATTLTAGQYTELQGYRRQLRDWPQGAEFPLAEHRPLAPPWLAEQTE